MNEPNPYPSSPTGLEWAHPIVQEWFLSKFGTPTEPQEQGWPHMLAEKTTLDLRADGFWQNAGRFFDLHRSTGAQSLDGSVGGQNRSALCFAAESAGQRHSHKPRWPRSRKSRSLRGNADILMPEIRTAVRTGDTLMHERRAMLKRPPHILVTTPESLYILLTAEKAAEFCAT